MTDHPLRVRLHGGRNIHAARAIDSGHITACAIYLSAAAGIVWMPGDTAVACRRCDRAEARAEAGAR